MTIVAWLHRLMQATLRSRGSPIRSTSACTIRHVQQTGCQEVSLDRTDWLLLFLTEPSRTGAPSPPLEPIRIMKGMFMITRRGGPDLDHLYRFEPYDYGPFTSEIYRDLDALEAAGLVAQESVPGRSWRAFRPTTAGVDRGRELASSVAPWDAATVGDAYTFVRERSFLKLLRDIYSEYPEYATRTVVKGVSPGS